jgi:arginyl-tRNA synthetase
MIRQDLRAIFKNIFPDEEITIDYAPKDKEGDYYTNLAFRIASREHKPPMEVAQAIAAEIKDPIIKKITVHQPAFINLTLSEEYLYEQLHAPVALNIGEGKSILIEYVSANPTGPINVVSARAAAVGDSLVRLLTHVGYKVDAEYYINDAGRQTDLIAESVRQRMIELSGGSAHIPENGYHGEYVKDVARGASAKGLQEISDIRDYTVEYFIDDHKRVMTDFGVRFDHWTRESDIYKKNYVEKVMDALRREDLVYDEEGAIFFKASAFGDDKDRVIVTSDKRNTYLLPDIAYHVWKIERAYDELVDIWGPDHHGRIKGIKGGIQALGHPADMLRILIVQEVKLKKGGKSITMSKRSGAFETLKDLLGRVPKDVVRYFFLMRSSSQHLDFDLDLALKQSDENPVYYVQYAHARIKSIIEYAREQGVAFEKNIKLNQIKAKEELDLIKNILKFPEVLEDAARNFEPYLITYYLINLAHDFHYFYQKHRVVSNDRELTQARLYLIERTAAVLKSGLDLLGVSCPDKM